MDLILPEQASRLRTQFEDESVDQPPLVKLFCHAINRGRTSAEVDRHLRWTSPVRVRKDAG